MQLSKSRWKNTSIAIAAFVIWTALYSSLEPIAHFIAHSVLSIEPSSRAGEAVRFFLYDSAKILLLLVLMVYIIGILRAGLNVEKVRSRLEGKGRVLGYTLAAIFGAITPFCSCSSVPLFVGFTMARIPLGISMAFLITSPIINEIAVILLWGLLGWKMTAIYLAVGILAGILGGATIDLLRADRWLQPFLIEARNTTMRPLSFAGLTAAARMTFSQRHDFAYKETIGIFKRVWKWVFIGVAIGALLHGYVPQEWFAENLSGRGMWTVPVAVIAGIPLYTNVTGIVPIMESLLTKGLPVGTTLAFCLSSVAISLPEMTMLKQVMTWKLLAVFTAILLVLFTLIGWLLNALPTEILYAMEFSS